MSVKNTKRSVHYEIHYLLAEHQVSHFGGDDYKQISLCLCK